MKIKKSRLYGLWWAMLQRATYRGHINRDRYDSLNISVDPRWKDFDCFFEDMWDAYAKHVKEFGERRTTLDRINNLKGYSKSNCRWATPMEQARNRKSNLTFTVNGERKCLAELIEGKNIKYSTAWARLKNGWDINKILKTPTIKK